MASRRIYATEGNDVALPTIISTRLGRPLTIGDFEGLSYEEKMGILQHIQQLWIEIMDGSTTTASQLETLYNSPIVAINVSTLHRLWEIETASESFCFKAWINTVCLLPANAPDLEGRYYTFDELAELGFKEYCHEVRVLNTLEILEQIEATDKYYCEIRKTSHGTRYLIVGRKHQYKLHAKLNLRSYPFDTQCFPIQLTAEECFVVHHTEIFHPLKPAGGNSAIAEWDWLHPTFECALFDERKPLAQVNLRLSRQFWSPVKNIIIISGLLTGSGLTCFSLPFDDWGGRSSILFTLLLTVVAFKLLLLDKLPKVPYDTLMDTYLNCGLVLLLGLICVCALMPHYGSEDTDTYTLYAALGVFGLMQMYFVVAAFTSRIQGKRLSKDAYGINAMVTKSRAAWLKRHTRLNSDDLSLSLNILRSPPKV
eukprot:Colp12_sorted_trinity150504_noHs@12130